MNANATVMALLDLEIDGLLAWLPEAGEPVEVHCDLRGELGVEDPASDDGRDSWITLVRSAYIADLREREQRALTSFDIRPVAANFVEVLTTNDDGHLERHIAASVGDHKDACLVIPLDGPVNEPLLDLLRGLHGDDRLRVTTDLIRVLGNTVRFLRDSDSVRRNAICMLRTLVSLARTTMSEDRDNKTKHPHSEGPHNPNNLHTADATAPAELVNVANSPYITRRDS